MHESCDAQGRVMQVEHQKREVPPWVGCVWEERELGVLEAYFKKVNRIYRSLALKI